MKRFGVLVFVLILFAGPVAADCVQRARVVTHQSYRAYPVQSYAAYSYPVYNYVPVAVFEPVKAVYAVGGATQAVTAEGAELARSLEKLTLAVEKLAAAKAGEAGQAQPPTNALQARAIQVMQARCASCHNEATAKAQGGDFVLFQGGQLVGTLDTLDVLHSANRAWSGSMPPPGKGPPVPQAEAQVLMDWAASIVKAERLQRKAQPQK